MMGKLEKWKKKRKKHKTHFCSGVLVARWVAFTVPICSVPQAWCCVLVSFASFPEAGVAAASTGTSPMPPPLYFLHHSLVCNGNPVVEIRVASTMVVAAVQESTVPACASNKRCGKRPQKVLLVLHHDAHLRLCALR